MECDTLFSSLYDTDSHRQAKNWIRHTSCTIYYLVRNVEENDTAYYVHLQYGISLSSILEVSNVFCNANYTANSVNLQLWMLKWNFHIKNTYSYYYKCHLDTSNMVCCCQLSPLFFLYYYAEIGIN